MNCVGFLKWTNWFYDIKQFLDKDFALGAFQALNWLLEKGSGVYTMNDMITENR